MKAWIERDVVGFGAGLGKMDIVVFPLNNGRSLILRVRKDGSVLIDDEEPSGHPGPNDGWEEIETNEELVQKIQKNYDDGNDFFPKEIEKLIVELVRE